MIDIIFPLIGYKGARYVFFKNKLIVIFSQIFLFVVDTANLFLSNIVIYEVTNRVSFNFKAMLTNKLFWILIVLHILHIIVTISVNLKYSASDKIVEKAIADQQIKILSQVTQHTENGRFENANKTIKIYDKLSKRRRK